jgi:hypothetical protein
LFVVRFFTHLGVIIASAATVGCAWMRW